MSRIVIPEGASFNAYHLLKLVATYGEDVLEAHVRQHVSDLFPDYYVIPFKRDVASTVAADVVKRPDLAMIDRQFQSWGVVEVEVVDHTLDHVLGQIEVFVNGTYNAIETARYVKEKLLTHCSKRVSLARLAKLFTEEHPAVLVIADELREDWREELERLGADLCTFELYKNTRGRHLYRTSGKYPVIPTREAHVRRTPGSANLLEITSEFEFKRMPQGMVDIVFDDIITQWAFFQEAGARYLRFAGGANPLGSNDAYVLFADRQERYYFRRN
jgi:hypothetical protein